MEILTQVIQIAVFCILSIVIFYNIGYLFIRNLKQLQSQEILSISFCLGVLFFVFLAVILGVANLRILSLPIIASLSLFGIWKNHKTFFDPWRLLIKEKLLAGLIILAIVTGGFINFPSGYLYKSGLAFWSSQGHDGLWHVASMEAIKKSIPPENPGFAGENIYNYHYLVDVLMGEFARIFPFLSSLDLYFRLFPILFSFMMSIAAFSFVARWRDSKRVGIWGLIFSQFVGSFGYIVNFGRTGSIFGGETVFWAAQQNTILGNPPHAISHSLLPTFLLSFLLFLKLRTKYLFFITSILGAVLAGFKVSGGFVMLIGLGAAGLSDLIFNKKIGTLLLSAVLGLSNFITFKLMTGPGAESFLMFLPWWFIRTMVVSRLDWIDLENRRQHYLSKGTWHAMLRVLSLEMMAFVIFLVGNLGMRVIGFFEILKSLIVKRSSFLKEPIEVAVFVTMWTGFLIPIFFVQKGLIYNNIQFMQYFMLLFGFYGAVSLDSLYQKIKNKAFRIILIVVFLVLSIPTVVGNLVEFYGPRTSPLSLISLEQLKALDYLKLNTNPEAVILNMPFNQYLKDKFKSQPRPIYAWYDTPYISALSQRSSYLASEHATLLAYPTLKERQENMKKFFEQKDFDWNQDFLKRNNINFIYLNKDELEKPFNPEKNNLKLFYENTEVIIYESL